VLAALAQHGYTILFAVVFLEAIGLPLPAAIALLVAGAAAANGSLSGPIAFSGAVAATMVGDVLMYGLGRYTGWWLLGLLCRVSLNPESCILTSADSFYRRGRVVLVFAKFLPGINTMAPPLAGSMNMRFFQFLWLDLAGTVIYIGTCFVVGYLFSGALAAIVEGYETFGTAIEWILVIAVAAYLLWLLRAWYRARGLSGVPRISPHEVAQALTAGDALVYDVRSHNYYDSKAHRIQGSRRLEPNSIETAPPQFPPNQKIYIYCTCIREATSARVAQRLLDKGHQVAVIAGGFQAWKKAGLPTEPVPADEIAPLPKFS
jgi:membrane protein DedA with SNARE-associated domain/rhodanese-related sulfurtransferase